MKNRCERLRCDVVDVQGAILCQVAVAVGSGFPYDVGGADLQVFSSKLNNSGLGISA
jgi:hypothetical protein